MLTTPICSIYGKIHAAGSNKSDEARVGEIESASLTAENVNSLLLELVKIYDQAKAAGNHKLARECQTAGMKLALFAARNKLEIPGFAENANKLDILIPSSQSNWQKAFSGNYSSPALMQKAAANSFSVPGHNEKYTKANVLSKKSDEVLPEGLTAYNLLINRGENGTLINIGNAIYLPKESPLNLGYKAGDSTTFATAKKNGYLLFTSANYTYGKDTPATLSVVKGKAHNLYLSPDMHGFVVIEGGRPKIYNLRKANADGSVELDYDKAKQLTNDALSGSGTVFQSNLLVFGGRSIVPESSGDKRDVRRVLAAFEDGSYAVINFNESLTLYELSMLLSTISLNGKKVDSAVNLDTGGCNVGGYRIEALPEPRNWGNNSEVKTSTLLYVK